MLAKKLFVVEKKERDGDKWLMASTDIDELDAADKDKVGVYELKEIKTYSIITKLK